MLQKMDWSNGVGECVPGQDETGKIIFLYVCLFIIIIKFNNKLKHNHNNNNVN